MADETKLAFFHQNRTTHNLANHLKLISNRKSRSLLSKLRLGTLDLEIESSRKHKIQREERFCKICDTKQTENELHFLLNCPSLSKCREPFLNKIASFSDLFPTLSPVAKIEYLFFNENLSLPELTTASDMLVSLKETRDNILLLDS